VAIALQVVLSLGHAHRIEGFRSSGPLHASRAAAPDLPTAAGPGDPASPAGPAFEYCAICAVIKMGAAGVPPDAPASGIPAVAGGMRFADHAEVPAWVLAQQLFQARAPPSA
jgi:hypothetical protein